MKSWGKKFIYVKLCLISPAFEIFINISYITSFIFIYTFLWLNGKYYTDNQILKFTESYIEYETFNNINSPNEFEIYLSFLINRLYTINTQIDKFPIFVPLNPIRTSFFLNEGCEENDFNFACYRNFTCVINSLNKSFNHQCNLRYIKKNNFIKEKYFLENLVFSFNGYYSKYDLFKDGEIIDITKMNLNENHHKILGLVNDKNLKFISLQINLKVPSNNNYVDVILGIEMNQFFNDIKKFVTIDVYNTYRPGLNVLFFAMNNIFMISTIINIVKLIYEMVTKIIWSIHLCSFLNEIIDVILIVFLIFYITLDKAISLEVNLKEFESHLIYSTVRKDIKIIIMIILFGLPIRFLSLLSWWKWISYPFVRVANVLFKMFPGVIISFITFFIFILFFCLTNYLIFQDIFSEYQSFYYSLLNIFNFKLIIKLYDQSNNSKIFHNLTHSKYVFIIVFFELIFFLISFALFISTFVYLCKKATIIESPKQENEYIVKLKQIQEKLRENVENEKIDSIGIKKQVLWLKLNNKSSSITDTNRYELILFKNSNQIISFLKYLFALKPELQFKKLVHKLNIVVEISDYDNLVWEKEDMQINKLIDWLTFVGCKIPLIIFCQKDFSRNFQMKLFYSYNLIQFIHNKEELEKIINEKEHSKFNVESNSGFTIISIKKNIISDI